jgi:hypothetical protein
MRKFNKLILAAAMLSIIIITSPLYADEADEREDLMDSAKQTLDKMTSEIKGFDKDSSAQDTIDAVKLSVALDKILNDLEDIQGDDDDATEMVVELSDHIKPFQAAAVRLAQLKNLQLHLAGNDFKDNCKKEQNSLDDVIKKYLPSTDPDGMVEIPKVATKVGSKASAMISTAEGTEKAAAVLLRAIGGFGARGDWSNLSAAVNSAAKAMDDDVSERRKDIEASCKLLAKGEKHPDVISARKKIADATGSELNQLQIMVDDWEKEAAGFFKTDCDAMQRMNASYCGDLDGDSDGQTEVSRLNSEVGKIFGEVNKQYKPLKDDLEAIRELADELKEEKTQQGATEKILAEIDDELAKLEKLKAEGSLKGFRNPSVQFYIKFGQQMHKRMESSYSCDVRDVAFKGRDRPDCVRAKSCTIFEFKPDSKSSMNKGKKQLAKYKIQVEGYYNAKLARGDSPGSKYGGKGIMQAFEKAQCISNKKITLGTKLVTYNRCKSRYQCVK